MIDLSTFWMPLALIVITASLSFVATMFWNKKNKSDIANASMRTEISDLKRQVDILTIPVQQMNAAFQAVLVKQLTHFHTQELDALLAKLDPLTLTPEEFDRLTVLLKAREVDVDDQIDASERGAAHMLPYVMERVRADLERPTIPTELVVVSVPKDTEKKDKD